MILAVILVLSLQQPLPDNMTCEQVRQHYASWSWVGRKAIRQYLTLRGYSRAQIHAAERCIK